MADKDKQARDSQEFDVVIPRALECSEVRDDGAWPIRFELSGLDTFVALTRPASSPVTVPRRLPAADEILTPEDVASHLALPKKTVIGLCADGRLVGAFKAGRRWRIPGHAVRAMAGQGSPCR